MYHFEATYIERWAWIVAIVQLFIPPVLIYLFLCVTSPKMPYKRTVAFYLGWIPGNLVACWYLHYSIGWFDAFMLLLFTQGIQLVFVITVAHLMLTWFGERMFRD